VRSESDRDGEELNWRAVQFLVGVLIGVILGRVFDLTLPRIAQWLR
jgi:hypothetical protein